MELRDTPDLGALTLTRKIGHGGSADIWLATLVHLTGVERCYAVKRLHADVAGRPEYQRRLRRELEIGLEVSHDHPNLVTTRGVETLLGDPVIVFELVEGPSLAAVRERLRHWHTIRCIAHDLLSALAYLARRRVLHRDVSAGNVLLDRSGVVRLGDFGMATWADGDSWAGTHVGTRAYRAPETLAAGCYSTASDLYSLGRVLWELCAGDVDADELPRDTPGDLRAVLRGLLEANPRRRWTAERALARLGSFERDTAAAEIGVVASAWLTTWGTVLGRPGHDSDDGVSEQGTNARQTSTRDAVSLAEWHERPRRWASVHLAAVAAAALLVGIGGTKFLAPPPREEPERTMVQPVEPRVESGDREPQGRGELGTGAVPTEPAIESPTGHVGEPTRQPESPPVIGTRTGSEAVSPERQAEGEGESSAEAMREPIPEHSGAGGGDAAQPEPNEADRLWTTAQQGRLLQVVPLEHQQGRVFVYDRGRRDDVILLGVVVQGGYLPTDARAMADGVEVRAKSTFQGQEGAIEVEGAKRGRAAHIRVMLSEEGGRNPVMLNEMRL